VVLNGEQKAPNTHETLKQGDRQIDRAVNSAKTVQYARRSEFVSKNVFYSSDSDHHSGLGLRDRQFC
jgi:hypothetical protein